MKNFELGDFVIINDFDQPCVKLIAMVIKKSDQYYECMYLSTLTNCRIIKSKLTHANKLTEFSLTPVFTYCHNSDKVGMFVYDFFEFTQTATYPDGKPRLWQGQKNDCAEIHADALPYLFKLVHCMRMHSTETDEANNEENNDVE